MGFHSFHCFLVEAFWPSSTGLKEQLTTRTIDISQVVDDELKWVPGRTELSQSLFRSIVTSLTIASFGRRKRFLGWAPSADNNRKEKR